MPADFDAREYFRGVETAARAALHPDEARSRPDDWLEHETIPFCEGYLSASVLLAPAITLSAPPIQLSVPRIPLSPTLEALTASTSST